MESFWNGFEKQAGSLSIRKLNRLLDTARKAERTSLRGVMNRPKDIGDTNKAFHRWQKARTGELKEKAHTKLRNRDLKNEYLGRET